MKVVDEKQLINYEPLEFLTLRLYVIAFSLLLLNSWNLCWFLFSPTDFFIRTDFSVLLFEMLVLCGVNNNIIAGKLLCETL